MKKLLVAAVLLGLIALVFAFDLHAYLSLGFLKDNLDRVQWLAENHRVSFLLAYVAIYVLTTAAAIPGAVVLTLAGGAIYGVFWGTIIISFASTLGATGSFLVARYLLRDWVQEKFRPMMNKVNEGVEKEGNFYFCDVRL